MKSYLNIVLMIAFVFAITSNVGVVHAQTICKMSMGELMSCKAAVTPPNPSAPSFVCCSALKHADLGCLCSYKNSNWLPSLGIDPVLAMQLPGKCRLPHPAYC